MQVLNLLLSSEVIVMHHWYIHIKEEVVQLSMALGLVFILMNIAPVWVTPVWVTLINVTLCFRLG